MMFLSSEFVMAIKISEVNETYVEFLIPVTVYFKPTTQNKDIISYSWAFFRTGLLVIDKGVPLYKGFKAFLCRGVMKPSAHPTG